MFGKCQMVAQKLVFYSLVYKQQFLTQQKVRWKLSKDIPGFDLIAKEFDLNVQPGAPRNTFIFSEKDLPGYRPNAYGRRFGNARDQLKKTEGGKVEKRQ